MFCEDVCSVVIAGNLYNCYDVGLYKLLGEEVFDGYVFSVFELPLRVAMDCPVDESV